MSRWLGTATTVGIVAFWVFMNAQLVRRELAMRDLDAYPRGVANFLGDEVSRDHWMGVYRHNRKIGYTGYTLERLFDEERIHNKVTLESRVNLAQLGGGNLLRSLFGDDSTLSIDGTIVTDVRMRPIELNIHINFRQGGFLLRGHRDGEGKDESLVMVVESGPVQLLEKRLPLTELGFSNGLALELPMAGFEVGETYELPVLNPITRDRAMATVKVVEETQRRVNGLKIDCFHVETRFMGMTYQSWITPDGKTVRQEIPPPLGVTLVLEERERARRGILVGRPLETSDDASDRDH